MAWTQMHLGRLWICDLKEGNALFVYYYTCKMLVPLQVLQKFLHKDLELF